jgi:hypothetical protein
MTPRQGLAFVKKHGVVFVRAVPRFQIGYRQTLHEKPRA